MSYRSPGVNLVLIFALFIALLVFGPVMARGVVALAQAANAVSSLKQ